MKKLLIAIALLTLSYQGAKSQILKPVTWSYAAKNTSAPPVINPVSTNRYIINRSLLILAHSLPQIAYPAI